METNVDLIRTPGHGRSEVTGSRRIWKASLLGIPQVPLGTMSYWLVFEMFALGRCTSVGGGIASKYFEIRPGRPPTSMNPDEKQNRSTEGCPKLKRSVDMTSSGKNGLNIRTNASPKWDRTRCPEE